MSYNPNGTITAKDVQEDNNPVGFSGWLNQYFGGKDSIGWQLGSLGLGLYGLFQNQSAIDDQLEEARKQFAYSQNMSRANFTNTGTNFLNQGLFQLEG